MQKTSRMQKGKPVKKKNKNSVINIGKNIILVILGAVLILGIVVKARHFILYHMQGIPHEKTVKSKNLKGEPKGNLQRNGNP